MFCFFMRVGKKAVNVIAGIVITVIVGAGLRYAFRPPVTLAEYQSYHSGQARKATKALLAVYEEWGALATSFDTAVSPRAIELSAQATRLTEEIHYSIACEHKGLAALDECPVKR